MNFKYQISNIKFQIKKIQKLEIGNYWKLVIIGNYKRGFTLVEMLIYMGILSVILVVLTEIFVSILNVQLESEATSSVEQDNKYIFSRLTYDINRTESDDIILPANLGDTENSLQISINGINYTYALNAENQNFEITNDTGIAYQLNSFDTTVSNLTFQRLGNIEGNHSIRINFIITSKTKKPSGIETRNFQTTVGTR